MVADSIMCILLSIESNISSARSQFPFFVNSCVLSNESLVLSVPCQHNHHHETSADVSETCQHSTEVSLCTHAKSHNDNMVVSILSNVFESAVLETEPLPVRVVLITFLQLFLLSLNRT
uniref:Uncharacterized protein n=1 Tax=Spongospora subterranea TaxID=70186 RepID=A0A0H5QKP9_9EUKA|eukprot:CRZ02715.1 hypothetical protein [Spongospora subterranea]